MLLRAHLCSYPRHSRLFIKEVYMGALEHWGRQHITHTRSFTVIPPTCVSTVTMQCMCTFGPTPPSVTSSLRTASLSSVLKLNAHSSPPFSTTSLAVSTMNLARYPKPARSRVELFQLGAQTVEKAGVGHALLSTANRRYRPRQSHEQAQWDVQRDTRAKGTKNARATASEVIAILPLPNLEPREVIKVISSFPSRGKCRRETRS